MEQAKLGETAEKERGEEGWSRQNEVKQGGRRGKERREREGEDKGSKNEVMF